MDRLLLSRVVAALCLGIWEETQARPPRRLLLHLDNSSSPPPAVASSAMPLSLPHRAEVVSLETATRQHRPIPSEQQRPRRHQLRPQPRQQAVSSVTRHRLPRPRHQLPEAFSETRRAAATLAVHCLEVPQGLKQRRRSHQVVCLAAWDLRRLLVLRQLLPQHSQLRSLPKQLRHPSVNRKHKPLRPAVSSPARQQLSHRQAACLEIPARTLRPLLQRLVARHYSQPLRRTTMPPVPAVCSVRSQTLPLPRLLVVFSAMLRPRHHSRPLLRPLPRRASLARSPLQLLLPLLLPRQQQALLQQLPQATSRPQAISSQVPLVLLLQHRHPQAQRHPQQRAAYSVRSLPLLPLLLHLLQPAVAYSALPQPQPPHRQLARQPPQLRRQQRPAPPPPHPPPPRQARSSAANPPTATRPQAPPPRRARPAPPPATWPPRPWDPFHSFPD